jgi:hypothetical protein
MAKTVTAAFMDFSPLATAVWVGGFGLEPPGIGDVMRIHPDDFGGFVAGLAFGTFRN